MMNIIIHTYIIFDEKLLYDTHNCIIVFSADGIKKTIYDSCSNSH